MFVPLIFSAVKGVWKKSKDKKNPGAKPKAPVDMLAILDWVIYGLPFLVVLFSVLVFAGCLGTSPGIPNLHLISLTEGDLSIRVGYFGMCFARTNATVGEACASTVGQTPDEMASRVLKAPYPAGAPSLIATARDLQRDILAPLFPAVGVAFMAALGVLGGLWRLRRAGRTSEPTYWRLRRAALALLFAAVALALMSALATTQTVAAVRWGVTEAQGPASGVSRTAARGQAVEALQWVTAVFMAVFAVRLAAVYRNPTSAGIAIQDVEMGPREDYHGQRNRASSMYSR
ncbi:hypothetical protein PpBr36_01384 [Pyricularia pennisetigena]|uniref:hypothetical protein n=1 Tax=Pyricularia pennisetigena TaxID=1578925 RepID=UPI00114DB82E|nr:hypothetical protein PpBr36_01384 [Pyricularia pennisetigena]TLS29088.1 hypothetical protein PpBr36_01384 [Pyricularia pennisetigena]